jgi:hypothetical protein
MEQDWGSTSFALVRVKRQEARVVCQMSQVTIVVTDKEDGTLNVAIQAEPDDGNSQAHQVSLMFLNMLKDLEKPQIITGE